MSNLFSANSYLWPALVCLAGLFLLAVVGFIVFAVLASGKKVVPSQATAPTDPPLSLKRLNAVLSQDDLHAHDQVVLETVASHLEPGPITKMGQQAHLEELIQAHLEAKEEKPK